MKKGKKLYLMSIILIIALFAFASFVFASPETIQAVAANFNFYVNGQNVELSEQPVVINGRTYLPVRALGEVLEKRVGWDQNTQTVVIDELLQDGVYNATQQDFDEHGWKAMVELTVKDGIIIDVKYDEIDKEGAYKSTSEEYLQQFKEVVNKDITELYKELQTSLVNTQNIELVDAVSGATYASNNFNTLVKEALQAGPVETEIQ